MIDLDAQLKELFKKEEMYAFFDFAFPDGAGSTSSGLCKISKPKGDPRQSRYFSLFILIDSPSEAAWEYLNNTFQRIDWDEISRRISGVHAILSIPYSQASHGLYFKEVDIYLTEGALLSRTFLGENLIPSVSRQIGMQPGEIVFWEDLPKRPVKPPQASPPVEGARVPLVDRVWEWIGI